MVRHQWITPALAELYSGKVGHGWMPIMLPVTTIFPPGVGLCLIKCVASLVPKMTALKLTSVHPRSGSGGRSVTARDRPAKS